MRKILILDDEPMFRRHLAGDIHKNYPQLSITSCETIQEAKLALKLNFVDAAIINYNLHDGYGEEVLPSLPPVCVTIGMSAQFLPADIRERFNAFLTKPFTWNELNAVLKDRLF